MKQFAPFYEIPLFYVLLAGINLFFAPHLPGFVGIAPHPFWFGILLFGFRYGIWAGFAAGLFSAFLYLLVVWFFLERYLFEELSFFILPISFILTGVLVGSIAARSRRIITSLRQREAVLLRDKETLQDEMRSMEEVKLGLEKKIVTRMATLVTLYEGVRRLEAPDAGALYAASLDFTLKTLQAEAVSIYLRKEGGWKLAFKLGWPPHERRPLYLKDGEGIIGTAGASQKVVTIRDFVQGEDRERDISLMGDALMAGPIRRGVKGETLGVLSVQRIPFLLFNSASVNLFALLLEWISRGLERLHTLETLKAQEIVDPELELYSPRYFHSRLGQEFLRSKTYYLPLSLGSARISGMERYPREQRRLLTHAAAEWLRQNTRELDVLSCLRRDDTLEFGILWVTLSGQQAREHRRTLLEAAQRLPLKELKPPANLEIGTSTFSPRMQGPEELLAAARERHAE